MKKKILIPLLASLLLVCVVAVGVFATGSTTEEFKVTSPYLTLGEDLRFNFQVSGAPEGATVKLLVWEGTATSDFTQADLNTTGYTELESTITKNGLPVFTYRGITAAEMGKTLYLRAYYETTDTTTGETTVTYTTAKRYSMAQYLWSVYEDEDTTTKQKDVIETLFAYGDAAQELVLNPNDELTLPKISDGVVKISVTGGTFADGFTEGKFLAGEALNVKATDTETTPTLTAELGGGLLWTTADGSLSDIATVAYSEGIYVGKYANAFKVTVDGTSTIYTAKTLEAAVELANGGKVTLLGNVDLGTGYLFINSKISDIDTEVTLDLNGFEIKSSGDYVIYNNGNLTIQDTKGGKITGTGKNAVLVADGSKVTISGGTFTGSVQAVGVYGGTVTITSGTFESVDAVYVQSGTAEITGGTFTGSADAVCVYGGTANISGGMFTGSADAVCVYGGTTTISGGTFEGYLNNYGTLNITGGTFSKDPKDYVDTTAYTVTDNGDGTYTVTANASEGGEGESEVEPT